MGFSDKVIDRSAIALREQGDSLESISLGYIFSVLRRRRAIIVRTVAGAVVIAVAYGLFSPTRYTASTTLVLDTKRLSLLQSEILVDPQVDDAAIESQVETIKSENVAVTVVKKLKLKNDPEFRGSAGVLDMAMGFIGAIFADDGPAAPSPYPELDALRPAIGEFGKGLRVTRIPRSYAVTIEFTSLDRRKAAIIANATAEAYIEEQLQAKFEIAKRAGFWLQGRIAELRDQASDAFKKIQDFKSKNNLIVSADGKLSTDLELDQLTNALAKARAETSQAQSRLFEIEAMLSLKRQDGDIPDATVTDALSSTVITKLRQQYLDDEKQEMAWSKRYGPNHQAVVNLRTEMESARHAIHEEIQRIAETYKSDLKVARSREESLEKRMTEVFQNNKSRRESEVMLRELETAASSYRSIYENFLNRYTQIVQQQSFPATEARVITFATIGSKSSPKLKLALALAIIGGVGLGSALAFVREQLDRAISSKEQLTAESGVPCIAAVPLRRKETAPEPLPASGTFAWFDRKKVDAALHVLGLEQKKAAEPRSGPLRPALLYDEAHPFSTASEALRDVKVAIDLRNISQKTRSIAIVSANDGEGKSSVALSLAATAGKAGRKVLLIDCDFRKPALTNALGLANCTGIIELLYGDANFTEAVARIPQLGVDFLAGPTRARPIHVADILNSEPMGGLLTAAVEKYDYVVVDLASVLPVVDVRACAHLFDAFVMVVECGKTSADDLDNAFRVAPLMRERLLGAVLNKTDDGDAGQSAAMKLVPKRNPEPLPLDEGQPV
jgi:polysaccharide biosynthesis transport protein